MRVFDVGNTLIDGHATAEGKNQDGNNQGPEIDFLAMPKRMVDVGRLLAAPQA